MFTRGKKQFRILNIIIAILFLYNQAGIAEVFNTRENTDLQLFNVQERIDSTYSEQNQKMAENAINRHILVDVPIIDNNIVLE